MNDKLTNLTVFFIWATVITLLLPFLGVDLLLFNVDWAGEGKP
jgi:hypothetical protein